jgi:hypothetical protein
VYRLLASIGLAGVLLVPALSAMAAQPLAVTVDSATLVAKGAGVEVRMGLVCQPIQGDEAAMIDWASFRLNQASGRRIATGVSSFGFTELTCDGTMVNQLDTTILADTIPFKNGQALLGWDVCLYSLENYHGYACGSGSVTVRVTK